MSIHTFMSTFRQLISVLVLIVCLTAGANAVGNCTIYNGGIPTECSVRCFDYGVNGDVMDPGIAAATYLNSVFPVYGSICTTKWILEIANSKFPLNTLRVNWLQEADGDPILMNINDIIIHTTQITSIQPGAFALPGLGASVQRLAIYYNKLDRINGGITLGLTSLSSFEWVGNGVIKSVDSDTVLPFRTSLAVLQISDCGFADATVVANITGCASAGSLPNVRTLELSFNPGPGLTVLGNSHLSQMTGVFSMYLWNSEIQHLQDNTVFDSVAASIQTIHLSNNMLTTMVNGTLDSIILQNKQRFTIALKGNPWHCDCQLAWLQLVLRLGLGNVELADAPTCASPDSERGKLLIEADMTSTCDPLVVPPPLDIC
ncbi:hypothetical protein B566_EDAN015653 [Ephemera danica]|nr:hypothetical protein B566_EDAN015653 [Ephemera danica]